jgi:hemin uptake protein HemP
MADDKDAAPRPIRQAPAPPQERVIDVRELLAGGREVVLLHAGERYRLRMTANDKLILTK